MHESRDSELEENRKEEYRKGGFRTEGLQNRRDAGKEEYRKAVIQERRDEGKEGCMKGGAQERRDAGNILNSQEPMRRHFNFKETVFFSLKFQFCFVSLE